MTGNRRIRVFVSSTFRDMVGERDELMAQAWPELRRFCRERQVEFVEVDLRWGIAEEQSRRKETLKLCLDEIHACRPFFIGLLGERYGWVPGPDAFTADLREEQPWLDTLQDRSVTELEIIHGVLREEQMHKRAFFYFRDPQYVDHLPPGSNGAHFASENPAAKVKLDQLKETIRHSRDEQVCRLRENYSDPRQLAVLVLEDLKVAIEEQFPIQQVPDALAGEARDHEAFAEIRRRTYIGRPEYFEALDKHAMGDGGPLMLLGDSGSGKSALVANWVEHWRTVHPKDFIFQHYIGSTPDSAEHWRLMTRLVAGIKQWSGDPDEVPRSHDDLLRDFPVWLAKARSKAAHDGVRFIVVLDALNQLDDRDHARLLGWLPAHPVDGALRLIVSTLLGDTLEAVKARGWQALCVEALTEDERRRMIAHYLGRFGKKLDGHRLERLAAEPAAANPLYLKILLDELRVTGTRDRLDERLNDYLAALDIPALLKKVLARYQRDYERDRPGLVGEALGLIWAARRGLTENELLQLLKPLDKPQLPSASWNPLRAAMEDGLVDRGGILNFAHEFLRAAVEQNFVTLKEQCCRLRLHIAEEFESLPISSRTNDELPWLLWKTGSRQRLRTCLLDLDRFTSSRSPESDEPARYWVALGEERKMGALYSASFEEWLRKCDRNDRDVALVGHQLGHFLQTHALYCEAEPLARRTLISIEKIYGSSSTETATALNNLGALLRDTNRCEEALPLVRRAQAIFVNNYGAQSSEASAGFLNMARLLESMDQPKEAEVWARRALKIQEGLLNPTHPGLGVYIYALASILKSQNELQESEMLVRRVMSIDEAAFGTEHPNVGHDLLLLASLLESMKRPKEAEPILRRGLTMFEASLGASHTGVATALSNLGVLLQTLERHSEAIPLLRRALAIHEHVFGASHPKVAVSLLHLAASLKKANEWKEAESLMRRSLIVAETSEGLDHPDVAIKLNNLASLLYKRGGLVEAEQLYRRSLAIREKHFGASDIRVAKEMVNLAEALEALHRRDEAAALLRQALKIQESEFGVKHPDLVPNLRRLVVILRNIGALPEAEKVMKRVLAIDEGVLGSEHIEVGRDLNDLGQILKATNQVREAEPLMRRALAIGEKTLGPEDPNVAIRLNNLAMLLKATKRPEEAEPLSKRALAIHEKHFGPDHSDVAIDLNNLGQLLKSMGRDAEAEPLLRRALRVAEKSLGVDDPFVATILANLAGVLESAKELNGARALRERGILILVKMEHKFKQRPPQLRVQVLNYAGLLAQMGMPMPDIFVEVGALGAEALAAMVG